VGVGCCGGAFGRGGGGSEPPIVQRSVILIHLRLDSGCQTVGRRTLGGGGGGGRSVIPKFSIIYLSPNPPDRFGSLHLSSVITVVVNKMLTYLQRS